MAIQRGAAVVVIVEANRVRHVVAAPIVVYNGRHEFKLTMTIIGFSQ